jgi:L-aspartate oxidase
MSAEIRDIARAPVIIGGGVAGLITALRLAPLPVVVLSKTPLGTEASSGWAQGGVAAALGSDDDPALHCADTLAAAGGLCDPEIAREVTAAAPAAVEALRRYGVRFDADTTGRLCLGLEAAHSRRRIVHAAGDGTGREIMRALTAAVRATLSVAALEDIEALRLLVVDGAVAGVLAAAPSGALLLPTGRVVIATGGVGGLFLHTTNPLGSVGQGLALAARAGAMLADLEFVQFHPTALDAGPDATAHPLPLVSEAVRGEGARLIDETGARFMENEPGRELAPRDVVARAVWQHLAQGHQVFLDARQALGAKFAQRFPVIATACAAAGVDPAAQPIPIRPAAHYHMGGIAVDAAGRSNLAGLWACGEAACTGLHGANRLASNSLLEAIVGAGWVAESIAAAPPGGDRLLFAPGLPPSADPSAVRPLLSEAAGVLRNRAGLVEALHALLPLACSDAPASDPAIVALLITIAALRREESRGAHFRSDFPHSHAAERRATLGLNEALRAAREVTSCAPDTAISDLDTRATALM